MYKKSFNQKSALGAGSERTVRPSKEVKNNNQSLGQKKLTKKGNANNSKTVDDDRLINLLGKKKSRQSVKSNNVTNARPKFYSQFIFFEKNKINGVISKPYFKNYYNSLDHIGRKNLKTFFEGLNDNTIKSISDIKSDSIGNKYLIVQYEYNGIKTKGYVWYMSGMNKLIQLASKFNFQLVLTEIVKESYR